MKRTYFAIMMIFVFAVMAGCGQKDPTEQLKRGIGKTATADSYETEGTLTLKFDADETIMKDPEVGMVTQMLNGSEIKYKGSYNKKTEQQMVTLDVALKGDMTINLQIPFILDHEDLYIKVPQIPMLPLSKDIVGKYVHLTPEDLKELNPDAPSTFKLDPAKQQELLKQVGQVLEKHYKDDKNLTIVKDGKPADVADLVQYNVNNDNVQEAATKLAKTVIPEVLQVLAKPEFKDTTGVTDKEVKEYNDSLKDFDKGFAEFQKSGKLNEAKSLFGTNKDGFLNYFKQTLDLSVDQPDEKLKFNLGATFETKMSKFNDSSVTITIPDKSQTISMEKLQQSLARSFGGY